MNTELLQNFANEINNEWTSNYSAILENNTLTVYCEVYNENNIPSKVEAGWINSKLDFGGDDEDVVDQLKYMIER